MWQGTPPAPDFKFKYEFEVKLYALDRDSGDLTLLATGNPKLNSRLNDVYLQLFRGRIAVLNSAHYIIPSYNDGRSSARAYFTRF